MGPVSVYRVGAVGTDPSYLFGEEARDSDLRYAAWLGWLPLMLVEFAGPAVALAGDGWLTAPAGRSEPRRPAFGDVVTAFDAAGELVARRDSGLTVFTDRLRDVLSDGPFWASSVAVLVADDLAAHLDRLRTAHLAVVEGVDRVEQERALLDACQSGHSGDSPARRCSGRAVRDLEQQRRRLHLLLEAAVRIQLFDPGVRG